ncbi:MAG: 50S ribosomal protein L6 [Gemmatimonadota bacterium]|nr:MAG: 50S ribosomal protein L6 [Gemmatimonadota bacterium]
MSRIGKKPVVIPRGVTVKVEDGHVSVKGPKGELDGTVHPEINVSVDGEQINVARPSDQKRHRALHGLTRSLLNNMVEGVTNGFAKRLEIHGVGYKAEATAKGVRLVVGYSHPVEYTAPPGVSIQVENPTTMVVEGIDKQVVGQVAAEIRKVRPPEPYKGKGIRYQGEHVRRKAGKAGAKA